MLAITEEVQEYRLALRQIWNEYVWRHESLRSFQTLQAFQPVKLSLYRMMIENRLDMRSDSGEIFGGSFRIVPRAPKKTISSLLVAPKGTGGYERFNGPFAVSDLLLTLTDFHDWVQLGYADFAHYQVLIESCGRRREIEGWQGLVEVNDADVVWVGNE